MKKVKKINNYYDSEGKTFEEIVESLIFSYLEEENDNRL